MRRGSVWWVDLPAPIGSMPGYERPAIIVSSDEFNDTPLKTVIVVMLTSQLRYGQLPGNFILKAHETGLPKDSAVNITQLLTIDKSMLIEKHGELSPRLMARLVDSLRIVLDIDVPY